MFELGPEPHLLTDTNGRVLAGNHTAAMLFGLPHDQLVGRLLPAFVPIETRRSLRQVLLEAVREAAPLSAIVPLAPRRGARRVLDVRVVRQVVGGDVRLSWLMRDVTDERAAQQALEALRDELEQRVVERTEDVTRARDELELERLRLEVLLQDLPVAVLMVEAATGAIVVANQHARELLRAATGDESARVRDMSLLRPDGTEIPMDERPITRALDHGEVTTGARFPLRRVDGSLSTIELRTAPLHDRDGRVVAAVIVAHDVTEQERRERAEREFLSNAAHQLRTPAAAIQSAIDVLEAGGKDDPTARDRFLGHIARASARLGQLSQSLLVLARAQSGQRVRSELVEVAPLLREAAALVRPAPGVSLSVRCRADIVALANADLLREAVSSLLDNAVRYTHSGEIWVRGRRQGRTSVVVEVVDSGRGMSPDVQARMFERFYGGEPGGGFGLGLAIASQAASAMGSELTVESEAGKGTAVRLKLAAGKLRTR